MADESVENNAETTLGGCTGKGFMPGQSGNPGGRPKKKPVTEICMQIADDTEAMKLLKQAFIDGFRRGDIQFVNAFADRTEGKVAQQLQHSGPDGAPIPTNININL